jgi:LmbE family N-acetylglucosaminyl deacetylase
MTHILAIHAHPDDIETLGAGTLALLAAKGHRITIATMTAGDCGSTDSDLEATARTRKGEATAAAALIGATYHCVDIPDLGVFNDDAQRRRTVEILRAVQPDIIITGSPVDYHSDHEATSVLVRDACFAAPVPNYRTGPSAVLKAIPHLYFMDPIEGRDRNGVRVMPDFGVDIGAQIATKREMLAKHASQFGWVAKQHEEDDYAGAMDRFSAKQGGLFGVDYAEGFRQYTGTPYPRSKALQELLGDAVRTINPQPQRDRRR